MKKIFLNFLGLVLMYSFANAAPDYTAIAKKLVPPNVNIELKQTNDFQISGFKTFIATLKPQNASVTVYKYLWISNDGKYVIPNLLAYTNNSIAQIEPKVKESYNTVNIEWFNRVLSTLNPDLKKSFGNGKTEVYILSDPYCPFCKEQLAQAIELAKQNKIKLYVIPFDVHGEKSTQASMLFWDIESKSNLADALAKVEAAPFEAVDKIVSQNQNLIKQLTPKYQAKLHYLKEEFFKHKLNGTPSIIIRKTNTKGIVIVGLTNLANFVK
ncbi:hypothetical protein DESACE_07420 [Desulfurella acetivorans A63]|nr:hypothetical protein DESACE_07420 [Desulfurella acetivorans A63]